MLWKKRFKIPILKLSTREGVREVQAPEQGYGAPIRKGQGFVFLFSFFFKEHREESLPGSEQTSSESHS